MFDERTNLAQQVMTELNNFFDDKLCKTTVPRNIRLAEAPSHGKAALMYDPRSKGAESYIKLAKEIIERQASGFGLQASSEELSPLSASETSSAEEHAQQGVTSLPAPDTGSESPEHGGGLRPRRFRQLRRWTRLLSILIDIDLSYRYASIYGLRRPEMRSR